MKNESMPFDKEKCLKQLNANAKKGKCHKLSLRDDSNDEPGNIKGLFDFCIPPFTTKYLTAEWGRACGKNQFWIRDRTGCLKTLVPVSNEKILQNVMKAVGFSQFVPFVLVQKGRALRYRLVFFSDSCEVDKKRKILECEMDEKGDVDIYHLAPQLNELIPHPLYVKHAGCSVD